MPYILPIVGFLGGCLAGYLAASALKDKELQLKDRELELYRGQEGDDEALKERFKGVSADVLREQSKGYKTDIKDIVDGVTKSMDEIKNRMVDFEKQRAEQVGSLGQNIQHVLDTGKKMQEEVHTLKAVLSQASAVRGRWGEAVLKNLLEESGLTEGIDFYTQETIAGEDSSLRPDVVVRLPGELKLAIDSKAGLEEYFKAVEEIDEEKKKAHLLKFAQNLRGHIKNLSAKEYQKHLDARIPFVVMFIPGEAAVRAVFEHAPELYREAQAKGVMLASPATIVPLVLLIAQAWKQQKTVENASKLAKEITDLGTRLKTFMGHVVGIGASISGATKKFNDAVSSWDTRVSPKIEQINVLGGNMLLDEGVSRIDVEPRSSGKLSDGSTE